MDDIDALYNQQVALHKAQKEAYEQERKARSESAQQEKEALKQWGAHLKLSQVQLQQKYDEINGNKHINDLFDEIESLHRDIKRLTFAEMYLEHLIALEEAGSVLRQGDSADIYEAIRALESLQALLSKLAYSPSLTKRATEMLGEAKATFLKGCMTKLAGTANGCQWPRSIEVSRWDDADVVSFTEAAAAFVRLKSALGEDGRRSLIKILMAPIAIRFAFHFDTVDRTTTDEGDRPDWFLKYLERVAREHANFLADYLDVMLGVDASQSRSFIDLFIDELVELAKGKLVKLHPRLLENSLLLSSTVGSVARFYRGLRDDFGYEAEGQGCLALFTSDEPLMAFWLQSELEAMGKTFQDLSVLPYDQFVSDVVDLFDSITLIYRDIEDPALSAQFFKSLQVPLLEKLYSSIEFSLPSFHSTPEDLLLFVRAASALDDLLDVIRGRWAIDLFFIELAEAPECLQAIGYDPSLLPCGLFSKILHAFTDLLSRKIIAEHIVGYLVAQFSQHASSYAKAMHYGITRQPGDLIDVHPGLQKALISLSTARSTIKSSGLLLHLIQAVEQQTLDQLAHFFFHKLVLKNYFHSEGTIAFERDLAMVLQQLSSIFSVPLNDRFAKCQEALILFKLPNEHLAESRQNSLKFTTLLQRLNISHLSAHEVEELLRLVKR